jgi:hypothetical protein
MKTYEQVIERAGLQIYAAYVGGYHNAKHQISMIAFIFEKTADQVSEDCEKVFKMIVDEHIARSK